MPEIRRLLVYLFYDPDGYVDLSVLHSLKAFRKVASHILVVSNGELQPQSQEDLEQVADQVIVRPNEGYDVGAHTEALFTLGVAGLEKFDELILANSTFFTVEKNVPPVFERMEASDVDFWGLTDHPQVSPNPITGKGVLPAHLQTYWVVVRSRMLHSPHFLDYWRTLPTPKSYVDVVANFETQFTAHFSGLGFTWAAAYPACQFGVNNPSMEAPLSLLDASCPVIKKRLYFHGTKVLLDLGVPVATVTRAALKQGLSREVIADGILRRTEADQATIALSALYRLPNRENTESKETGTPPAHANSEAGGLTYSVVNERPWKHLADGNFGDLFNKDIIFVAPRGDRTPAGDGALWRRKNAHEAVLSQPDFIAGLFKEEPKLGALVPTLQFVGSAETDRKWVRQARKAWQVAELLGLADLAGRSGPIAAYCGIAAYRTDALKGLGSRIRAAGGWQELAERAGGTDRLEAVLDQVVADHALTQGFYTGQVATNEQLAVEAPLWMVEAQAGGARFRGYLDYPHGWGSLPSSPLRGSASLARTDHPKAFSAAVSVYRALPYVSAALGSVYKKARKLVGRDQ